MCYVYNQWCDISCATLYIRCDVCGIMFVVPATVRVDQSVNAAGKTVHTTRRFVGDYRTSVQAWWGKAVCASCL